MRNIWLAALGIMLVAAGIAGIVWTTSARAPAPPDTIGTGDGPPNTFVRPQPPDGRSRLSDPDASLGARVYLDGLGEDGRPVPRTAIGPGMMGGGCVRCHGVEGTGGYLRMMGGFEVPDIRYSTLTSPHEDHAEDGWTDRDIVRAVTEGIEPDGDELDPIMPRWELSDAEFRALLDYLKELDTP